MKAKIHVYMYRQLLVCNSLERESKYAWLLHANLHIYMWQAQLKLLYMIRFIIDQSSLSVLRVNVAFHVLYLWHHGIA